VQADRANQQGGVVWRRVGVGGGGAIDGYSSSGATSCDSSGNNISGNTG